MHAKINARDGIVEPLSLRTVDEGVWFYEVQHPVYDQAYFDKYVAYANTPLGFNLTTARYNMVNRVIVPERADLVDVGIGCGQFVERSGAWGYDVNPAGIAWLKKRNRFWDLYAYSIGNATFWDSFEHIKDINLVLTRITRNIFMSIPIFTDRAHVLRSKHFRPDEHYWYFTHQGLRRYMRSHGWVMLFYENTEMTLGREDIVSFAFQRIVQP